MAKQGKKGTSRQVEFTLINPHAGGIDIGSKSHWVGIGPEDEHSREFGVFTEDLHNLCKWVVSNGVTTIAMESTGFYWKQLFVMLQSYGLEVYLVNASFTKNVQGKKPSDKADGRWIWRLHSAGLLPASFQPDGFTEELRTYVRHRKQLIQDASRCVNRMQKSLTLMNIHLPIVLSDIVGKSGKAIIKSILGGQRDAKKLAALADPRVKADKATIEKALTGFWRADHLFELKQSWEMYQSYQAQIKACDEQIDTLLQQKVRDTGTAGLEYKAQKKKYRQKNSPTFQVETYAYQLSKGVDLLEIDGIGFDFVLTLLSEVGMDLKQFPSAKHFVSWLCLCPNKKVSGGKVLSSKTRKNKQRLRLAFKQAAVAVAKKRDNPLSAFYRRMAARHGKGTAVTATARKLAIIVYNMLVKGQPYQPEDLEKYQQKVRKQKIKHIQSPYVYLIKGLQGKNVSFKVEKNY